MAALTVGARRAIVRTHVDAVPTDTLDVGASAWIEVTSEQELYPVDHLFDGRSGPGGSAWIAAKPGPQRVRLVFLRPTDLESVVVESEERAVSSTQEITIVGRTEAHGAFELPPRTFHYKPYEGSFHHAVWEIAQRAVTEVSFLVTPAPARRLASLTAIIFR